jgi:hypothetical protein
VKSNRKRSPAEELRELEETENELVRDLCTNDECRAERSKLGCGIKDPDSRRPEKHLSLPTLFFDLFGPRRVGIIGHISNKITQLREKTLSLFSPALLS